MSLTYLGLPINPLAEIENEFNLRDIQKPNNETLNIYDVDNVQSLSTINLLGKVNIFGDYKVNNSQVQQSFPLLQLGFGGLSNVSLINSGVQTIVSIPFWNPLRGDGKGFSVDLGYYPVRLKVFQDAQNSPTSRFTISTTSSGNIVNNPPEKDTIGFDINGSIISNYSTSLELRGAIITADTSFTAKYLGIWFEEAYGNTQMAIYTATGVFLGKTEIKNGFLSGRQLYTLENSISIVSGTQYIIAYSTDDTDKHKVTSSGDLIYSYPKSIPFNQSNITFDTYPETSLPCIWIENNWDDPIETLPVENNSFNIWANGMVSIGNTLSTATYAPSSAGDLELNSNSLLIEKDLMLGINGTSINCLARIHAKATLAEFDANRFIAYFGCGDNVNASGILRDGEYIVTTPGKGLICKDEITNNLYRIKVSNGILQAVPYP